MPRLYSPLGLLIDIIVFPLPLGVSFRLFQNEKVGEKDRDMVNKGESERPKGEIWSNT